MDRIKLEFALFSYLYACQLEGECERVAYTLGLGVQAKTLSDRWCQLAWQCWYCWAIATTPDVRRSGPPF